MRSVRLVIWLLAVQCPAEVMVLLLLTLGFWSDKDISLWYNQLDASNVQNLFCHETLHVSGIFCAHHQELSAVRLAIGMFHAGYVAAS